MVSALAEVEGPVVCQESETTKKTNRLVRDKKNCVAPLFLPQLFTLSCFLFHHAHVVPPLLLRLDTLLIQQQLLPR